MSLEIAKKRIKQCASDELHLNNLNLTNEDLVALIPLLKNTEITSLDLSDNQLTEIPESIGDLTGLEKLYLSYNQLTEIPQSIGDLTGLKTLDLYGNKLTEIPQSIGGLTGLKNLDLSDNQLTEIPQSIGDLTGLKKLYLSSNQLTEIPQRIGDLTGLEMLSLDNNPLNDDTRTFLNHHQTLRNIVSTNMAAYENNEDIRWDDLGVTNKTIIDKVQHEDNPQLKRFVQLAQSSSLYQKDRDVLKQGLNFLLNGLLEESSLNEEIMKIYSTDCSTPVATICMQFYVLSLNEQNIDLPEEMIAKLALSDYLSKNAEKLQINTNDIIEKVNAVLNAFFLKDSHQHSDNKLQVKHDHDQPSNTTYIEFSYNQLSQESANLIAQDLLNTDKTINQEKFNAIISKYKKEVLGLVSEDPLLNKKEHAHNYLILKAKADMLEDGPAYKLLVSLGGSKDENIEALAQRIFLNENMSNSDIEKVITSLMDQPTEPLMSNSETENNISYHQMLAENEDNYRSCLRNVQNACNIL